MVISVEEMVRLERECGVPLLELMENAGRGLAETIMSACESAGKRILIFCGPGNNGGDGFVAARYLCEEANISLLFLGDEEKLTEISKKKYELVQELVQKNKMIVLTTLDELKDDYDIFIDAMLGTGIAGKIREPLRSAILFYNDKARNPGVLRISVDVPSGINPDTGAVADIACDCDKLITFHDAKQGLISPEWRRKTTIVDIGIRGKGS